MAAGHAPHLDINGDGLAVREYLHVDDLAAAYVRALEAVRPGEDRVYNVGSGTGTAVHEVVAAVEKVTGSRCPPAADRPARRRRCWSATPPRSGPSSAGGPRAPPCRRSS